MTDGLKKTMSNRVNKIWTGLFPSSQPYFGRGQGYPYNGWGAKKPPI